MKNCILCGKETEGSVGAAGIKWSMICQSCKDIEDTTLLNRIKGEGKICEKLLKLQAV